MARCHVAFHAAVVHDLHVVGRQRSALLGVRAATILSCIARMALVCLSIRAASAVLSAVVNLAAAEAGG